MLPLLRSLADNVFTMESLDIVARASPNRTPNYGQLRALLDGYAETLKPKPQYQIHEDPDIARARKTAEDRALAVQDWSDPQTVMRAARELDGHPWRSVLGGMLGGLVFKHAPQNQQYLPPEFIRSIDQVPKARRA
jgi:hypothetical protein